MHRLSLRTEPSVEQEDAWNPDDLLSALLSVMDKPMGAKVCRHKSFILNFLGGINV